MGTRTTERSDFGERLFKARQHAKLSQAALADKVGMAQTNLSHLELRGLGTPKVAELARTCGVRVEWLATGRGSMLGPETPEDAARVIASETMPAYGRAPSAARDYRSIVHNLAAALEDAGIELTVQQFLVLADATYRQIGYE
jgi:transcriptional regulator with XRE-family HTH domain